MLISGQQSIADFFGVSRETIDNWQKDGLPVAVRGGPGMASKYDSAKCLAWRIRVEVEKVKGNNPQDRLATVRADRIEIELSELRMTLIPASLIEPMYSAFLALAREKWEVLKRQLILEIPDAPFAELEAYLQAAFDAYLGELSKVQPSALHPMETGNE